MKIRSAWLPCLLLPLMGCVLPQGGNPGASANFVQRPYAAPRSEPAWADIPTIQRCRAATRRDSALNDCGAVFGCLESMSRAECVLKIEEYHRDFEKRKAAWTEADERAVMEAWSE
ncbi:MAG: hypothetical protein A2X36_14370 [Elusimicrobia bacterium GWA2_69_24]|nr:MAG: hypothetical protein A2X36_14370 [Elusimicrobia bacterium GWA2_69_24]HBL18422.1 hypothetical protein [Elusimicrobiota bacterium]